MDHKREDRTLPLERVMGVGRQQHVCLMSSSEKNMNVIMEKVNECVIEQGLTRNEKKSKVVCINGEVGRR